jgi:mRNA-degrading endonuclease RelE of RelBE toxin-antitoxin system
MIEVEWTSPAFAQLEVLPQALSFEIVRRVDMLESFPEMGARIISDDPGLRKCRQLIIKSTHRVVYEYDQTENTIYILAIQHCRQKLPTGRELKRRQAPEDN